MALASSHEKVIERVASKRIAPELRRIRNTAFEARPQAASEEPEVAADNARHRFEFYNFLRRRSQRISARTRADFEGKRATRRH